jgi:hypothetical protein
MKRSLYILVSIIVAIAGLIVSLPVIIADAQGQTLPVTVTVQPPTRPVAPLLPSGDRTGKLDTLAIDTAWYNGNDVLLGMGAWYLNYAHRPAHASLDGANEYLTVIVPVGGCQDAIQGTVLGSGVPASMRETPGVNDGGHISNLTFDSTTAPNTNLYHEDALEPQLNYSNLRIIHGNGPVCNSPGATSTNIEFIHGSLQTDNNYAKYSYLAWYGMPDNGMNEWQFGGDGISVAHVLFQDTQRAIVFHSETSNVSFLDIDCESVNAGPTNANEVILDETLAKVQNVLFDQLQVHNCRGSAFDPGTLGFINNKITHFDILGGEGITFGYKNNAAATSTGNVFSEGQMTDCGTFAFFGSVGNSVDHLAIINPKPTWGNQQQTELANYGPQTFFVGAAGNTIDPQTVTVVGLPVGWTKGF